MKNREDEVLPAEECCHAHATNLATTTNLRMEVDVCTYEGEVLRLLYSALRDLQAKIESDSRQTLDKDENSKNCN